MKILSVLLITLFCFSGLALAGDQPTTSGGLVSQVEAVPKVFTVTPTGVASLPMSRWMQFSLCKGEKACCNTLDAKSLQYKDGAPKFTPLDGLVLEVPIDSAYRSNGNILITWTLRVEGHDGAIINPWRTLCGSWHGEVTETFKGGQVYSQAYVDMGSGYSPVGEAAVMTIPDGGFGKNVNPHDPTHSGSFLLKASDVKDGFPAKVKIKIYWKNDTSMNITSKESFRSLIVTVLPSN
jgi:hypothetical protein